MLIIPAIDIRGGQCVRLFQGDYAQETVYGRDPIAMAERWISQGAKFLHLVDLDGAREGNPRNQAIVQAITRKSPVPVEVGGGIRDHDAIEAYLSAGINRVIVGTAAYRDPRFLESSCARWPGRVAVDIAARDGRAAVAGWTQNTEMKAVDLARECVKRGASTVIYTDVYRDGTREGVNLKETRELARAVGVPVIASGGVSTLKDIEALLPLEEEGVVGVIVGRALYAGTLNLPEAISLAERGEG